MKPDELLADKKFFLAFAMARIPEEALQPLYKVFDKSDFIEAIIDAPAGIFITKDEWRHWNNKFGLDVPFPRPAVMQFAQ